MILRIFYTTLWVLQLNFFVPQVHAQLHHYQTLEPTPIQKFEFSDVEGNMHTLSEFKGKIVIVNFWATWCAPCLQEMPSLNNLALTFPQDEVAVITICKDKSLLAAAKDLFDLKGFSGLTLFFDHQNQGAGALQVKGLPSTLVINKQGDLIGRLSGATEWDHFEVLDLIQSYINGHIPEKPGIIKKIITQIRDFIKI